MLKYSIMLQWSDEDNAFVATVPELPGLSALGNTPEKATKELLVAQRLFLDVIKRNGDIAPAPEKLKEFSGQLRVRIPKSLHASLSNEAKKEEISLNTYIVHLLSERNCVTQIVREVQSLKEENLHQFDDKVNTQTASKTMLVENAQVWNEETSLIILH